jgi:outer membrane protein TolC
MMTKNRTTAMAAGWFILVSAAAWAQEPAKPGENVAPPPKFNLDYTNTAWFPKFYVPYQEPLVPQPPMSNSERLRAMTAGGKLLLSAEEAIALALENNLDIAVARYGPAVAQTDITRAKSGGATRGVQGAFTSSALFAGALGGGISGGGGNFSGNAGGAFGGGGATNIGGFSSFDPVTGVTFGWDRRSTPLGITLVSGVPFVTTQTTQYQSFFGQRFQSGTSYLFALSGTRQSTTSLTNVFNPQVSTNMLIGLNQPLLNGFGRAANSKFIRISKNNARIADSVFRQQVIAAITQVLNLYYDLVYYRDNVRVAERSLALAEKTLNDNRRQVEIGTLAPIEVVRAESEVAARQQDLIIAQTNLQKQQTLLKTALAKQVDATIAGVEIEPTDILPAPQPDDIPPVEEALRLAYENRPEIEQSDLNLRNQEIVIKANRNSLLPSLDFFASYAGAGLAGNRCGTPNTPAALCPTPLIPGGGDPDLPRQLPRRLLRAHLQRPDQESVGPGRRRARPARTTSASNAADEDQEHHRARGPQRRNLPDPGEGADRGGAEGRRAGQADARRRAEEVPAGRVHGLPGDPGAARRGGRRSARSAGARPLCQGADGIRPGNRHHPQ